MGQARQRRAKALSPTLYIGLATDILHHGHTNIIAEGRKLGQVIIGLLSDEAVSGHKRLPLLRWGHRKKVIENILGVTRAEPQESWGYAPNLRRYRPDYMVHGTDWLHGPLAPYRARSDLPGGVICHLGEAHLGRAAEGRIIEAPRAGGDEGRAA